MPKQSQENHDAIRESIETPLKDVTGQIDLEQLRHRLSLTPAERIRENDRFARFAELVRQHGGKVLG